MAKKSTTDTEEMKMPEDAPLVNTSAPEGDTSEGDGNFKLIPVLIFVLFLVAALGLVAYMYMEKESTTKGGIYEAEDPMTPAERAAENPFLFLMAENDDFKNGQNALSAQKYSDARQYFESAFTEATIPAERGQIEYKLAIAESWDGDPVMAVQRLKQVVLNEEYSNQQRSYALMRIGEMYHTFNSLEVVQEIFVQDDFFKENFTQDDANMDKALIALYEYGASLKPVAVSELRLAWYYMELIKDLEKKETLIEDEQGLMDEYYDRIYLAIENADKDYEETLNIENVGGLGPRILVLKATILGELTEREKETMERASEAFEQALVASQIAEGSDAKIRYQFARFMMRIGGEANKERINDILVVYSENREVYSNMLNFFARHAIENPMGSRPTIIGLGKLSPSFRLLLIDLGFDPEVFTE